MKLHASLGFCEKILNLYIVEKIYYYQYIELKNDNFLDDLSAIISQRRMPVLTISHYLYGKLTEEMSNQGFKVVLSGYGADEVFTGYYDHFNFFLKYLKLKGLKKFDSELKEWKKSIKPWIRNPFLKNENIYFKNKNFRSHIYLNNNLFSSFLNNKWNEGFYEKKYTDDILRNRMLNETFHEVIPPSLFEEDLHSMRNSI